MNPCPPSPFLSMEISFIHLRKWKQRCETLCLKDFYSPILIVIKKANRYKYNITFLKLSMISREKSFWFEIFQGINFRKNAKNAKKMSARAKSLPLKYPLYVSESRSMVV